MKQLLVLRHAKSSWKQIGMSDHDRPLNKRGLRDAPRVGRWMAEQGLIPDVILSSTAVRARTTARIVADACDRQDALRDEPTLYLAGPDACLAELRALDDELNCAMLVGHNPGLEHLLEQLTGEFRPLPTAALAQVQLDVAQWSLTALDQSGQLLNLWTPKSLPDDDDQG